MIVLNAKNIVKIYNEKDKYISTKALNGITLTIDSGEFVGVMGPSGSGKTTLLNILSGIDKPTSGSVEISDKDIYKMNKNELALFRRQKIGFVFQDFNLLDSLNLKENVMLPLILDLHSKKASIPRDDELSIDIEKKASSIMSLFGIGDITDKYPHSISGGQQQKVAICRAIINDPDIVFADEPTGNLDSKSSTTVMQCLEALNTTKNNTILLVTHDPYAASYCNKIIFIKDGIIDSQIVKRTNRKDFFDDILKNLSILGDDK